ncbi:hypothetical protein ACFLZ4_01045 [Patescibacteria group bacterium]
MSIEKRRMIKTTFAQPDDVNADCVVLEKGTIIHFENGVKKHVYVHKVENGKEVHVGKGPFNKEEYTKITNNSAQLES